MPKCITCLHGSSNGTLCIRHVKLQDGTVITATHYADAERDERHASHKRMKRDMADVCGKSAKWWRGE